MNAPYRTLSLVLVIALLSMTASPLNAQACHGTPSGGGVAYEYGKHGGLGTSHGVNAALGGRSLTFGLGARLLDISESVSGQEAHLRLSIGLPLSKLLVCPGIALGYSRSTWDAPEDISVTSQTASLRAGAGLGIEQEIYGGLAIIPFLVAQYEFALTYFEPKLPGAETDATGDSLSQVQLEYGIVARYRFVYAGIAVHRTADQEGSRPYMARYIVGFAFSGGAGGSRSRVPPARRK
jgi:hypothetical protein